MTRIYGRSKRYATNKTVSDEERRLHRDYFIMVAGVKECLVSSQPSSNHRPPPSASYPDRRLFPSRWSSRSLILITRLYPVPKLRVCEESLYFFHMTFHLLVNKRYFPNRSVNVNSRSGHCQPCLNATSNTSKELLIKIRRPCSGNLHLPEVLDYIWF
jgi:hypothetical protein